jgi:mannosyl-3-phosphoglycerate phosphatase
LTELIIFTDIDGTLIDFATYSFAETAGTVKAVLARRIPLILCSSKTRAEQESLRQALAIPDPFIVENGSAIFVPPGTFPFPFVHRRVDGWQVIELGVAAATIQTTLMAVRRETGLVFQGYADLSPTEVAHKTGLDKAAAAQAQQREYSETIVTPLSAEALTQLEAALAQRGLTIVSGGKFYTVMGVDSDKGRAVTHLTALFRQKLGNIITIGLGDSANDRPLLRAVDRPYLVQKPDETWQAMDGVEVERVAAVGPRGWRLVVEGELYPTRR